MIHLKKQIRPQIRIKELDSLAPFDIFNKLVYQTAFRIIKMTASAICRHADRQCLYIVRYT